MRPVIRGLAAAVLMLPFLSFGATFDEVFHQLENTHTFDGVSVSPDGLWITWTEHTTDGEHHTFLKENRPSSSPPREVPSPDGGAIKNLVWSRDNKQLAFFSETKTQRQIYVMRPEERDARLMSHLDGYADDLRWSPDGNQIAFLYAEKANGGGPLAALPAQTGEIGEHLHNQRLTLLSLGDGSLRAVTTPDLNIYEYDWSPDGGRFAAIAAPGPADNNWWTARLYTVGAQSGDMQLLYASPVDRQIAIPRWSPDSTSIAFIGGIMSDEGAVGGDIFVLAARPGSQPRDVSPNIPASARNIYWTGANRITALLFEDGESAWARIEVSDARRTELWKKAGTVASEGLSLDGKTAVMSLSDWQHPPSVWVATDFEAPRQLTNSNAELRPDWGKAQNLSWTSDGYHAQGWLLYPANFEPGRRYPMIVSVHGGPAAMRGNGWPSVHFDMSVFAGLGYFVFFPNPRGSYGRGEAYTRGNIKDFGHGDLNDILAGMDEAARSAPVDTSRVGLTGWSYGGYMTMWAVTQSQRFRAAVAGAGIANWLSYYGENSIDEWMVPYFGAPVYQSRGVYARSSPIEYINQTKTPTLVLVGERDAECPAPQSFEFWHALKTLGVPTQLVVYEGEGHGFEKEKDQVDRMRRTADWFNRYLNTASERAALK